jgi:hypothetical protein
VTLQRQDRHKDVHRSRNISVVHIDSSRIYLRNQYHELAELAEVAYCCLVITTDRTNMTNNAPRPKARRSKTA